MTLKKLDFQDKNHEKAQVCLFEKWETKGELRIQTNQRFNKAIARRIHPATNDIPPMGVMAPIAFISEMERTYKLPENKMMPILTKKPAQRMYFDLT